MSLDYLLKFRRTVAFRLTFWYAGIFTASSIVLFIALYLLVMSNTHRRTEQALLEKVREVSSLLSSQGIEAVTAELGREATSTGTGETFFRIVDTNGEEITSSDLSLWTSIGVGRTALRHVINGGPVFENLAIPGRRHKVRILYAFIGPDKILQIGRSLRQDEHLLEDFREIFLTTMLTVLVVSGIIGWFMAKRALSGVEEVTQTAIHIGDGELHARVPVTGSGDEIDRLAMTFNNMLERIQSLVNGMKEMTDNIAHDLKSPITRIRGIAETSVINGESGSNYEMMAGSVVEECDRLLAMINTMLEISEMEAKVSKLTTAEIDLAEVVRNGCDLFQPIAADKGITLKTRLPFRSIFWGGMRLRRVVSNLLDNSLKYTPSGGTVTVSLDGDEDQVCISFQDTGIGISPHDLPHIFKRFYRGDRSRSQPGAGLGLSLARAIVRAHGGDITVTSSPGKGSTFVVTLPRKPRSL